MCKYKNFIVPLLFSLVFIFSFSIYQYTSLVISSSSYTSVENNDEEKTFFITSDLHYLAPNLTDYGESFTKLINNGDGKEVKYIDNILDGLNYDIQKHSPNFLIISGDLTFNGERESHLALASKLNEIQSLGTNIYVIPGNHDINNPWARKFSDSKQIKVDSITAKEFSKIYNNFGYKGALSRDSNSLSYLVAPTKTLWLLMLDDNKYNNNIAHNIPNMSGFLSAETLQWIRNCSTLAKKNNAKLMVVTHHNLINHSYYIWDGYTLDNSKEALSVFKDCDIKVAFSGHIHMQSIKKILTDNYSFTDISSTSLAVYPHKYGVLKVNNNLLDYSTSTVDLNKANNNLKDYSISSREFYTSFVYNQNYKNLLSLDSYSSDEIKAMCETLRNIRLKYDSELDEITWEDIRSSEGFSLLKNCDSIYIKHYLKIAIDGNVEDNNKIQLSL